MSHVIRIGGARVEGTRFSDDGTVSDFDGVISRPYKDLMRATQAARRKYHDLSISVFKVTPLGERYRIDDEIVRKYGEKLD